MIAIEGSDGNWIIFNVLYIKQWGKKSNSVHHFKHSKGHSPQSDKHLQNQTQPCWKMCQKYKSTQHELNSRDLTPLPNHFLQLQPFPWPHIRYQLIEPPIAKCPKHHLAIVRHATRHQICSTRVGKSKDHASRWTPAYPIQIAPTKPWPRILYFSPKTSFRMRVDRLRKDFRDSQFGVFSINSEVKLGLLIVLIKSSGVSCHKSSRGRYAELVLLFSRFWKEPERVPLSVIQLTQ